jgi:hypothetical protein
MLENYALAFPDMHRELCKFYSTGNIVVVQLALQGTHLGPLKMPGGMLKPTGKRDERAVCRRVRARRRQDQALRVLPIRHPSRATSETPGRKKASQPSRSPAKRTAVSRS